MAQTHVSVVIPTYNRGHLISRAILSVTKQLLPGDEIIVVDDGSTDNTAEIVAGFGDRVKYVQIDPAGAGEARNRGVREARNELIAFVDSDDEWMEGKLLLQRRLMEALPDILFSFSDFAITDRAGNVTRHFLQHWHNDPRPWEHILGPGRSFSSIADLPDGCDDFDVHVGKLYDVEMSANYIFTSSLVVRSSLSGNALRFGEALPTYEDWECFGLLARQGLGAYLDVESAWQHGHTGERLTDANPLVAATARIAVLERVWGSDPAFLERKGDEYHKLISQQHLIKAVELVTAGLRSAARQELRFVDNPPLALRIIALLPGPVARRLYDARRRLKKWI